MDAPPRVLIAPGVLRGRPGDFRAVLTGAGFELVEPPGLDILPESKLVPALLDVDAVLAGGESYPPEVVRSAPRLRVIARVGVGYDAVDLGASTERGIVVTITPGTNEGAVAEQAFALLLALTREVVTKDREVRRGEWNRTIVRPLRGQTLGIVGLGRAGKAVALRARAFGMRVLAFEPGPVGPFEADHAVERRSLAELLAESDVVTLHLPVLPETVNLFNDELFGKMRPGALFVNTARGALVDEEALLRALASGHLGGAGLDVFREEPPAEDCPFFGLPNVVLSPHIAGVDSTAIDDMARMAAQCVARLYRGDWPGECVVNREVAEGWRWSAP